MATQTRKSSSAMRNCRSDGTSSFGLGSDRHNNSSHAPSRTDTPNAANRITVPAYHACTTRAFATRQLTVPGRLMPPRACAGRKVPRGRSACATLFIALRAPLSSPFGDSPATDHPMIHRTPPAPRGIARIRKPFTQSPRRHPRSSQRANVATGEQQLAAKLSARSTPGHLTSPTPRPR